MSPGGPLEDFWGGVGLGKAHLKVQAAHILVHA